MTPVGSVGATRIVRTRSLGVVARLVGQVLQMRRGCEGGRMILRGRGLGGTAIGR